MVQHLPVLRKALWDQLVDMNRTTSRP